MKGMELAISPIILLVLGLIVLAALAAFMYVATSQGGKDIDDMQKHSELCKLYSDIRCTIANAGSASKYVSLQSEMMANCKKVSAIPAVCLDFDKDCGRPCCSSFCGAFVD